MAALKVCRPIIRSSCVPGPVRSLRVCVVGSGVGGMCTADKLIKNDSKTRVDILEKLPVPYGLIRYGVAPDHGGVKNCVQHLASIADSTNCRFIGNVSFGRDITLTQLQTLYHAVVLACGAEESCELGIPGEDLPGVYSAKSFYSWYNGLPRHRDLNPDLSGEVAVIIGQGNVALDVARILLTPTPLLEGTDICDHALTALRESQIKRVFLVGRQGPLQVTFSTKELRNMASITDCGFYSDPRNFDGIRNTLQELPRPKRRLMELMLKVLNPGCGGRRQWNLYFKRTPVEFIADEATGRLAGVRLEINELQEEEEVRFEGTGKYEVLPCSMVLRSIGYRAPPLEGIPYEPTMRTIPNRAGRVTWGTEKDTTIIPRLYCSGWVRTGPVGAVMNTMSSAYDTAEKIIQDHKDGKLEGTAAHEVSSTRDILDILSQIQGCFPTSFTDWKLIDRIEQSRGHQCGKPREKIASFDEITKIIKENGGGWLK